MSGPVSKGREEGGEDREGLEAGRVGPCGEDLGFYQSRGGALEDYGQRRETDLTHVLTSTL